MLLTLDIVNTKKKLMHVNGDQSKVMVSDDMKWGFTKLFTLFCDKIFVSISFQRKILLNALMSVKKRAPMEQICLG